MFTQFNRVGDPPDNLRPLPSKNIDTGMGLERTVATLQGVPTNYHIDNLMPIVEAAAEVCGVKYELDSEAGRRCRRITDHVRACTFAVHENVYPGANKEKYVVKRLLRRAVLDGHQLGLREPFLHTLVPKVVEMMGSAYPELKETTDRVSQVIEKEEANFFSTIDDGLNRIQRTFDDMRATDRVKIDGAVAADLYQTYGVPPELFEALAAEHNLAFDWDGYAKAMQQHGEASGKVQHTVMGAKGPIDSLKHALHNTEFVGYESTETQAVVKGIIAGHDPESRLCDKINDQGHADVIRIVLDRTPFYGESGGQVGDIGKLTGEGFEFDVIDTQKDGQLFIHHGHLKKGIIHEGDTVTATVDTARRDGIRRAHSATHILHHALQSHLGSHAQQQGSKVDDDWLRFDFTNLSPVSPAQLTAISNDVVANVHAAAPIDWQIVPLTEARSQGAMMLFGEKYPDPVRMVSMGPFTENSFSKELCGGTHLENTSQVEAFEIISEEGISAGTRRITALTGRRAAEHAEQTNSVLTEAANLLNCDPALLAANVTQLVEEQRELKKLLASGGTLETAKPTNDNSTPTANTLSAADAKSVLVEAAHQLSVAPLAVTERIIAIKQEVESLREKLEQRASAGPITADGLLEKAETLGDATLVIAETPTAEANLMRQLIDQIRQKSGSAAVMLASTGDEKVTLVAGVSKDLQEKGAHAGNWVRPVAQAMDGNGGGRPDMAQAGGKKPEKLPEALEVARTTITEMLKA